MMKEKMTKKKMNMAMLAEALRSLNEIVMEEEPEDWDEENMDEEVSGEGRTETNRVQNKRRL
jgi:hypothetical protein